MKTDVFPMIYNQKLILLQQEKIEDAKKTSYVNEATIRRQQTNISCPDSDLVNKISWFVGFVLCACVTVNGSFTAGVITLIVSGILGMIMNASLKSDYHNSMAEIDKRIGIEKQSLEKKIEKIQDDTPIAMKQYYQEFESNAQQLSVQYASSKVAQEVIEWMTSRFCQAIDAAKRDSYVETIEVPFMFRVFKDEITCNFGTYNFMEKRCQDLDTNLKQAALSRAIASAIQVSIIMKYPKDITGTQVKIDLSYKYSELASEATITYIAPNANFKAVREW